MGDGAAPEVVALARAVARLRSEVVDLEGVAATTVVVERAKGVLMAGPGGGLRRRAYQLLLERAGRRGGSVLEECWITLGQVRVRRAQGTARMSLPKGSPPGAGKEPGTSPGTSAFNRRAVISSVTTTVAAS